MATKFCVLTSKGRGAIATVEVFGLGSTELLQSCFRSASRKPLASFNHNSIVYGNWLVDGVPGEDLVICPMADEHFEIHCHGGTAAVQAIVQTLSQQGATPSDTLENRNNACELDDAISKAPTRRTALILLQQKKLHRELKTKLSNCIEELDSQTAIKLLESAMEYSEFGLHLTEPWSVVLCGRPNVGKSSLINAIVGFERTIVSPTPGTTRDAISLVTSIDGWPTRLTDTAGFRDSADQIEMAGIKIAKSRIANADVVVAVLDSSQPAKDDLHFINQLKPQIVVYNKIDIGNPEEHLELAHVPVSATSSNGVPELMQEISSTLVPAIAPQQQVVPISQKQISRFQDALIALRQNDFATAKSIVI